MTRGRRKEYSDQVLTISGGSATCRVDPVEDRHYTHDVCYTSSEKHPRSLTSIEFIEEALKWVTMLHHDPLVITTIIGRKGGKSRLA